MKKFIIVALSLFICISAFAQDSVHRAEYDQFKTIIQDSIQQIGKRVDNANETYTIAKQYSENAEKLHGQFISMMDVLWGIAGLLLGGLIVILYNISKKNYETKIESKIAAHTKQIERLIASEKKTIFIKENANILVVHKGHHDHSSLHFKQLEKTILSEFKNAKHCSAENFDELNNNIKGHIKSAAPLKVILLNDDLFNSLATDEKNGTQVFTKGSERMIEATFKMLKDNNIGLVLFGQTHLAKFDLPYLAFSKQPYSTYSNVNNLLKYMMVAQKIKV